MKQNKQLYTDSSYVIYVQILQSANVIKIFLIVLGGGGGLAHFMAYHIIDI